jgi:hypothetical protein
MSYRITKEQIDEVREIAEVFYLDRFTTHNWNQHLRRGELRVMGGWAWISKNRKKEQVGFRTPSAAYIDAYKVLIQESTEPVLGRVERAAKKAQLTIVRAA